MSRRWVRTRGEERSAERSDETSADEIDQERFRLGVEASCDRTDGERERSTIDCASDVRRPDDAPEQDLAGAERCDATTRDVVVVDGRTIHELLRARVPELHERASKRLEREEPGFFEHRGDVEHHTDGDPRDGDGIFLETAAELVTGREEREDAMRPSVAVDADNFRVARKRHALISNEEHVVDDHGALVPTCAAPRDLTASSRMHDEGSSEARIEAVSTVAVPWVVLEAPEARRGVNVGRRTDLPEQLLDIVAAH